MQAAPSVDDNEKVAAYRGMVEAHAARFTRLPFMQADFDDFVQEGLIAVWEAITDGHRPSNVVVTNAMRDWARTRRRQLANESPLIEDDEELAA